MSGKFFQVSRVSGFIVVCSVLLAIITCTRAQEFREDECSKDSEVKNEVHGCVTLRATDAVKGKDQAIKDAEAEFQKNLADLMNRNPSRCANGTCRGRGTCTICFNVSPEHPLPTTKEMKDTKGNVIGVTYCVSATVTSACVCVGE